MVRTWRRLAAVLRRFHVLIGAMAQLQFDAAGTYRTPPHQVGPLARLFPSLAYYPGLFRTIFRASAQARRGEYGDMQWRQTSLALMQGLERIGVRFEITGVNHLRELQGPAVIAGNHISALETAVLPVIVQPIRPVTFVVKKSLIDYPVFRHVMRARDPIAVTQTDARADLKTMLTEGVSRLKRGVSIIVFPQGQRSRGFEPATFNSIAVKLAERAGVPIVPLALSTDAWRPGVGMLVDFGRIDPSRPVHFAFGPPIKVTGRGGDQNRQVIGFIERHLAQWKHGS